MRWYLYTTNNSKIIIIYELLLLLLLLLLLWQWRCMDAIWIPIQPASGVERNLGGPKANNSIASKVCT